MCRAVHMDLLGAGIKSHSQAVKRWLGSERFYKHIFVMCHVTSAVSVFINISV